MSYIFRNKPSVKKALKRKDLDDPPIGSSERGSIVPLVFGSRKVSPIFAWAGNRKRKSQSSGGKGTAGGDVKTYTYFESGVHVLCVGPAYSLTKIYQNGDVIFEPDTPINPITAPSGTIIYPNATYKKTKVYISMFAGTYTEKKVVRLKSGKGNFRIYWGDSFIPNYPTNDTFSEACGVTSQWPRYCYIVWESLSLGTSPNWPSLEYEISTNIPSEDYNAATEYVQGQVVKVGSNLYWYINATATAGTSVTDTTYWHLLESNQGLTSSNHILSTSNLTIDAYVGATEYKLWDVVSDSGVNYIYINNYPATGKSLTNLDYWNEYEGPEGANPASIIKQVVTAPFPYGAGLTGYLNDTGTENLGTICETENLALNALAEDADTAEEVCSSIMTDAGVFMSQYLATVVPYALRADNPVSTLTEDVIGVPSPSILIPSELKDSSNLYFLYSNKYGNYRDADIVLNNDSTRLVSGNAKARSEKIKNVTDNEVAYTVAQRRELELTTTGVGYEFTGNREVAQLRPGNVIAVPGITEALRVSTVEIDTKSEDVIVNAFYDYYSIPLNVDKIPVGSDSRYNYTTQVDWLFAIKELPYALNKTNKPQLVVLRQRGNEGILGANLWITPQKDTISYFQAQTYKEVNCVGGLLGNIIYETDKAIINEPPLLRLVGPVADLDIIPDLSEDPENWLTGTSLVFINNEIFFLENYTSISWQGAFDAGTEYLLGEAVLYFDGYSDRYFIAKETTTGTLPTDNTVWRESSSFLATDAVIMLNNLVRAQYDTIEQQHNAGDSIFVAPQNNLSTLTHNVLTKGVTVDAVIQPFTAEDTLDTEDCSEASVLLTDRHKQPLPCDNFRGNTNNTYIPTGYVLFTWTYRVKDGNGTTPGEILAGDAVPEDEKARDGYFLLEIYNDTTLKRQIEIDNGNSYYAYSHENMVTDFGGEPDSDFNVKLYNVIDNVFSRVREISITRDESASGAITTPPVPNTQTWAYYPTITAGSETTSLTMVASTATGAVNADHLSNSVEYYFECVEGPDGVDRTWDASATFEATGLRENSYYIYKVRARDSFGNLNDWSTEVAAYTNKSTAEGMNWLGEYNSATQYAVQDAVNYLVDGKYQSYICTVIPTIGTAPTDTGFWDLLAAFGDDGNGYTPQGAWTDAFGNYSVGDTVTRSGTVYVCTVTHNAGTLSWAPGTGANWENVWDLWVADGADGADGDYNYRGAWDTALDYAVGDVVANDGLMYYCIATQGSSQLDHDGPGTATGWEGFWSRFATDGTDGIDGDKGDDGDAGPAGTLDLSYPAPKGFNFRTFGTTHIEWDAGTVEVNGVSYPISLGDYFSPTSGHVYFVVDINNLSTTSNTFTSSSPSTARAAIAFSETDANVGNGRYIICFVQCASSPENNVYDMGIYGSFINVGLVTAKEAFIDSAQIVDLAVDTIKVKDGAITSRYEDAVIYGWADDDILGYINCAVVVDEIAETYTLTYYDASDSRFPTGTVMADKYIYFNGFASADNNGYKKVVSISTTGVTTTTITVDDATLVSVSDSSANVWPGAFLIQSDDTVIGLKTFTPYKDSTVVLQATIQAHNVSGTTSGLKCQFKQGTANLGFAWYQQLAADSYGVIHVQALASIESSPSSTSFSLEVTPKACQGTVADGDICIRQCCFTAINYKK